MPRPPRVPGSRWGLVLAGLLIGLTIGLVACGSGNPDREELTEALTASGVPDDVARCTADALLESLSDDELARLVDRGAGGAPPDDAERDGEAADRLRDALSTCREDLPAETVPVEGPEGGSSTVPPGLAPGTGVSTTVPPTSGPAFDTVPPDRGTGSTDTTTGTDTDTDTDTDADG